MKIREGAYYRTRDGNVLGPMTAVPRCDDTFTAIGHTWNEDGSFVRGNPYKLDLISEVYVSDTPPSDEPAAPPSDDIVLSFNLSERARESRDWSAGRIGFWLNDRLIQADFSIRLTGLEGKSPRDTPQADAPAPEAKTLRDEFAMEAMKKMMDTSGLKAAAHHEEANRTGLAKLAYGIADAMMEARKK
jgi:hypothetical protein